MFMSNANLRPSRPGSEAEVKILRSTAEIDASLQHVLATKREALSQPPDPVAHGRALVKPYKSQEVDMDGPRIVGQMQIRAEALHHAMSNSQGYRMQGENAMRAGQPPPAWMEKTVQGVMDSFDPAKEMRGQQRHPILPTQFPESYLRASVCEAAKLIAFNPSLPPERAILELGKDPELGTLHDWYNSHPRFMAYYGEAKDRFRSMTQADHLITAFQEYQIDMGRHLCSELRNGAGAVNPHIELDTQGMPRKVSPFGMVPLYYVTEDGQALSPEAVIDNLDLTNDPDDTQWYVIGTCGNDDDNYLRCAHTNKLIPSASGPEDEVPEDDPNPNPSADAHIHRLSASDWWMDMDGLVERRTHLGQSAEGFHYAVETSHQGGDGGDLGWSRGYPTLEEATAAKHEADAAEFEPEEDFSPTPNLEPLPGFAPAPAYTTFPGFAPMPTEDEIRAFRQRTLEQEAPNCISNWFPLVQKAGLRVPETKIFKLEDPDLWTQILYSTDGENPFPKSDLFPKLYAAYQEFGGRAFMKMGNFSFKHNWEESCFLGEGLTQEDIEKHLTQMIYGMAMVDCPESEYVAVRALIDTKPAFLATNFGNMPVTRERRLFTDDQCQTVCSHPYWPKDAFRRINEEQLVALNEINTIQPEEDVYLRQQAVLVAEALSPLHSGGWSVDFLQDRAGDWWLIDVAKANQSYHWPHDQA